MNVEYPFQNHTLPLAKRVTNLLTLLTFDEKVESMLQYQPAIERLGVRAYKHGTEAAHGIAWLGKATSFPQPIGLGCTWDTDLMKQIGDVIGEEARIFYNQNKELHGLTLWAPTVDMERDPRWGRTEESYGEDPVLTGELTASLVQGMQGDHPIYYKSIATLKHFIANNNEIERGSCSASIDPRNMKEYYQAAFRIPFLKGGAKSMMTSYNAVNGTPTILLDDVNKVVKEEWNLDGFIVSDAGDLLGLVSDHHFFDSDKEAVASAIRAGIDSITDDKEKTMAALHAALEEGLLTIDDIDKALFNTFKIRFMLGEFDPSELNPYANIADERLLCKEHEQIALQAALKSIVLLKNEQNILPLSESYQSIAVVGPLAQVVYRDWYSGTMPYEVSIADGLKQLMPQVTIKVHDGRSKVRLYDESKRYGVKVLDDEQQTLVLVEGNAEQFYLSDWDHGSFTLQRTVNEKFVSSSLDSHMTAKADEAFGWFVKEIVRLKQADEHDMSYIDTWNHKRIQYQHEAGGQLVIGEANQEANGLDDHPQQRFYMEYDENGIEQAVEKAKHSELAIVVVGNHPLINGKEDEDRPSLELPLAQRNLIKRVYEVNPNTVVVIVGSYPYCLDNVVDYCSTIVYLAHAGQEQGRAVAQVLCGKYSPAGRLNMTWYKSEQQLSSIMDYDIRKSKRTYQYVDTPVTFPFGHGLSYANFSYASFSIELNEKGGHAHVAVTNQSKLNAEEVVQFYFTMHDSAIERPQKKLIAFQRVMVKAGETLALKLPIDLHQLEIWDVVAERFVLVAGTYQFMLGQSSEAILLTTTLQLDGYKFPARTLTKWTKAETCNDYSMIEIVRGPVGLTAVKARGDQGSITFAPLAANEPRHFSAQVCGGHMGGTIMLKSKDSIVGAIQLTEMSNGQWRTVHISLQPFQDTLTIELTGSAQLSTFILSEGDYVDYAR